MTQVVDRFLASAGRDPAKPAIVFHDSVWTYGDVRAAAARVAAHTAGRRGVALVFLPQGSEAIALYFGLMQAGLTPSFMPLPSAKQDPALYWSSHRRLVALIDPTLIVTMSEAAEAMRAELGADAPIVTLDALDSLPPPDPARNADTSAALLQHSSGTTGLKKGVALSHAAIDAQVDAYAAAIGATADDVVVSWLPVYHDMGLIACTVMPLMRGQTIVLLDPFRWTGEPGSLFTAITQHRGTLCWLPNFAFEHLRRTVRPDPARYDLSSMRAFINCSEPCRADTFDRFAERFAPVGVTPERLQVCYAMAETVFAVSQTPLGRPVRRLTRPGAEDGDARTLLSCGPLLAGAIVHLAGGAEEGEIQVAAPFLFDGYYRRPELTAERLVEGAYATRDLGLLDGGEVFVLGRTDDLLIVHGRNYYAHEIEATVAAVPGVKPGRAVAFALDNPVTGSQEAVVLAEGSDGAVSELDFRRSVKQAVLQAMGLELRDAVKVPPSWLVKTSSGKLSRTENRTKYLEAQAHVPG